MANGTHSGRPRFLNLMQIRMPATAWTSVSHRLSGILLFLAIPLFTYLLQLSLGGESGFSHVATLFSPVPMKLLLGVLIWSLFHHLLAGIRFLLIDLEWGLDKHTAQTTAHWVNALGIGFAVLALWRLW